MMAIFIVMGIVKQTCPADQMKQAEVLYYRGMVIMM